MKSASVLLLSLMFLCFSSVRPFDICSRVINEEQLDLLAIALTPRRFIMLSSNLYVYDLNSSLFDEETHQVNLNGLTAPVPLQKKWPVLYSSTLFQTKRFTSDTMFFVWDDVQDYIVMMNCTEGLLFGLGNNSIWHLSMGYHYPVIEKRCFSIYWSGPKKHFFGGLNKRYDNIFYLVWANIAHDDVLDDMPLSFCQAKYPRPVCYHSSLRDQILSKDSESDPHEECGPLTAWWLVSTGFWHRKRLYLFGSNHTVYIFDDSIEVTNNVVQLTQVTVRDFFKCPVNRQVDRHIHKPVYRVVLITAIWVVSVFCLFVWIALCVVVFQDGHGSLHSCPSSQQSSQSINLIRRLDKKNGSLRTVPVRQNGPSLTKR